MVPPFCPNPACPYWQPRRLLSPPPSGHPWFQSYGCYHSKRNGRVPRFRCRSCGRSFSPQTFALSYYEKRRLSLRGLVSRLCSGESLRAIGRAFHCSVASVSNRIARLARARLAAHDRLTSDLPLAEPLAADGFESFTRCQDFPEHLCLLLGSRSQFLYSFSHCTLRRKGRKTARQKARCRRLEAEGAYPLSGVSTAFETLLGQLPAFQLPLSSPPILFTDEHPAYPGAVRRLGLPLHHCRIPGTAARTRANPLFPVNYFDRELRKDLAAHRRETVCFARDVRRSLERLAVYAFHHNYEKPFRIGRSRELHALRHGQFAGITRSRIEAALEKSYHLRPFFLREPLRWFSRQLWSWQCYTPPPVGHPRLAGFLFT